MRKLTSNHKMKPAIITSGDPAGIAMTASLGTADPEPDSEVTGIAMSASVGTLDAFNLEGWGRKQWNTFAWGITGSLITTGQAATANIGTLSAEGDANVTPTGIAMSGNVGTLAGVEISFEISSGRTKGISTSQALAKESTSGSSLLTINLLMLLDFRAAFKVQPIIGEPAIGLIFFAGSRLLPFLAGTMAKRLGGFIALFH